jgi:hypothetical protein
LVQVGRSKEESLRLVNQEMIGTGANITDGTAALAYSFNATLSHDLTISHTAVSDVLSKLPFNMSYTAVDYR